MAIQITILGLGQVGASIGLALADKKDTLTRVGNDRSVDVAKQAQRMGAVDQVQINLPAAVRKADVVVLAMPVDEIRETLEVIASDLKEGCVVMDTSPVKVGVSEWAKKILPAERHFVGLTPALNPACFNDSAVGVDAARADLFKNSLMMISSPPGTEADALKLAADLAQLIGSTPFYGDPYESDGLMAAVSLLPELLAAALVEATVSQPGWTEARKLAGKSYASVSRPLLDPLESGFHGQSALINKDNTLRMLDTLAVSLHNLRQLIADGDEAALKERIGKAAEARTQWEAQRHKNNWDVNLDQPMPTAGEIFGRMFGLGGKPKDKKK